MFAHGSAVPAELAALLPVCGGGRSATVHDRAEDIIRDEIEVNRVPTRAVLDDQITGHVHVDSTRVVGHVVAFDPRIARGDVNAGPISGTVAIAIIVHDPRVATDSDAVALVPRHGAIGNGELLPALIPPPVKPVAVALVFVFELTVQCATVTSPELEIPKDVAAVLVFSTAVQ